MPSSTRVEDTTVVRYARRGNASADYHAVDSRPFESAFLLKRYDWSSYCSLFVGLTHAGRSKTCVELSRETLKTMPTTIQFFSRED